MKNILISAAFISFTTFAFAQQEPQPNDDQLQQQAPRETQRTIERSAKIEAVKQQNNTEVNAEKEAKDKGQSQKQTKAQAVGINPSDSLATPKKIKK